MKVVDHLEGKTHVLVPSSSLSEVPPPTTPVFYNPAAALNRDVTVAVTAALPGSTFCDAMAGVGARGIRVASEVPGVDCVAVVDFNHDAISLARRSARRNGVAGKCKFSESETLLYLYSRNETRFDFVDLDPFGSPARYLQAGLSATSDGGVLSVTATDTAVLCGVYPDVAFRRYGAVPVNNRFGHETGLRILASAMARAAAQVDLGVSVTFAHSTRHYMRVYMKVEVGAARADRSLQMLGFLSYCPRCGHVKESTIKEGICVNCGKRSKVAGPLWTGQLTEGAMLSKGAKAADAVGLEGAAALLRGTEGVDAFPPWSFSVEGICSSLKVPTVPEDALQDELRGRGYKMMRTPFEKTGIKTDATYQAVVDAVGEVSRSGGARTMPKGKGHTR